MRALSPVRRFGLALALGTLGLAIIATQWPFRYRFAEASVARRWSRIDWSWVHRTEAGSIIFDRDFALNLMMLVPLGIGFGLWRRAGRGRVLLEAVALGTATSVILELGQLVTWRRYTALPDVWRNALGCMVGAMLAIWILSRSTNDSEQDRQLA
ncbi:MAG: VanZ family protein [Kofleriaceae bacterium]